MLSISLTLFMVSCTTARYYPTNFIESLKHPARFPDVHPPDVKNVEDVAHKNPLGDDEEVKIIHVSENKNASMHLIQIRENAVLRPHYHRRHDKVIYVEKGTSIATVDGSRYVVKPGSMLQIPNRTVLTIHNTGDETFVAVAIYSPPFDGRDEKFIGGKRKADRGAETKRRLIAAGTKTEIITGEDTISDTDGLEEKENHGDTVSPKKLAEKNLNRMVQEDHNIMEKERFLQTEPFVSQDRKEPKETASSPVSTAEKPAQDIRKMHEILARLFRLKESGILSAEEYEEKKDAVMKGRDIGELPEIIGYYSDQTALTEDDFSTGYPGYEFSQMPDVSYGKRKSEIPISERGKTLSTAARASGYRKEEKIRELEELYQEGLITKDDYTVKKGELLGSDERKTLSAISGNVRNDKRLRELKELYQEGLITKADYEFKRKELSSNPVSPAFHSQDWNQDEKLSELNKLREQGLISEENYELKKMKLLNW